MPRIVTDIIPRIGWFTLSVNNCKRPLGVFDVRYEGPWIDSNNDYQELDVPIQSGSMITGTYNNELQYPYGATASSTSQNAADTYDGLFFQSSKVSPVDIGIVNPASAANYDGYIVAVHLKCEGDINLKT